MNIRFNRLLPFVALALLLPLHLLRAQNTTEVGYFFVQQNNGTNDNATSITVTPSLSSFTNFQTVPASVNRGDFHVNVGNGNNDRGVGTYIVSVAQNGRNNTGFGDNTAQLGTFYATASPVISTAANGAVTYISAIAPRIDNNRGPSNNMVNSILLLGDGKLFVSGNFAQYTQVVRNGIARVFNEGQLDTTLNSGTGATNAADPPAVAAVNAAAMQADGKFVIGGAFLQYNGTARNRIARINTNGSLDTGFNVGTGANNAVLAIAVQADGKILIGGSFTDYNGTARNRIARLNSDGTLDTGFDPGTGANASTVNAIVVQADGKILIGGGFASYNGTARNRIARLNEDGSLDTTFTPGSGANASTVNAIAVQTDGKILIGGGFASYNGTARNRIARLNSDGTLDTGFDPGSGANASTVNAIAVQADGKILISGGFTEYNGTGRNRIARLNSDGGLDAGFDPGTGANSGTVNAIAVQADGRILIGGGFTQYNGVVTTRIARLNSDGGLDLSFSPGSTIAEVNLDVAAGFFPYDSWLSGFAQSTTILFANPGIQIGAGQALEVQSPGVYKLNLQGLQGAPSSANGVLLSNDAVNNSQYYTTTKANPDGSFQIYRRLMDSSGAAAHYYANGAFTFTHFALSQIGQDGLTALGRVNNDGSTDVSSGNFTVTKGGTGEWYLSIDGHSADTGTLLITPAGDGPDSALPSADNLVSYQWDGPNNRWVIQSRDLIFGSLPPVLEDGATPDEDIFSFVFFEQQHAPIISLSLEATEDRLTDQSTYKLIATAADQDGEVVAVEFFRTGTPVGTSTGPFELLQQNIAAGLHRYTAVAIDNDGRRTTSAEVIVQVFSKALTTEFGLIEVTQHNNGNTSGVSVTGSVRPGSSTPNFSIPINAAGAGAGNSMTDRGDYHVRFGNTNDVLAGTVISCVTENGRDNTAFGDDIPAPFYGASNMEGAGASFYYIPVNRVCTIGATLPGYAIGEVNMNVAVGFFPYSVWLGGYARNSEGTNGGVNDQVYSHPDIRVGEEFYQATNDTGGLVNGVSIVDLRNVGPGYGSHNGIVLACHGKNEANYATVQSNADGTFTLRVRDNAQAGGATSNEQDPIAFVFLPVDRIGFQGLTALGRVKGDASTPLLAGPAVVSKGTTGRYYVSIPGESPDTGTFFINMAGGEGTNSDNVTSYQWDEANQRWIVESRDMQAGQGNPSLQNVPVAEDAFSFAFFKASARTPLITLSAPGAPNGRVAAPATFTVQAETADEDGEVVEVEFFINGVSVGVATSAPFELPQTALAPGSYSFTARARDNDDYTTLSAPLRVEVMFADEPPANTALWFDGVDDHVILPVGALGVGGPPTLGFTLECWFRQEGAGTATATSQSLAVLPLISKGRQETENNNTDVNYLLGLTADGKLGVDFEAFPSTGVNGGANYPLVATHDSVETGRWYHAVASYDGVTGVMKLYLDGVEVGSRVTVAGARPRFDSNHFAAIGAAYNTQGVPAGAFPGVIDEVRVWNHARSEEEIQSTINAAVRTAGGLAGRFGMDEGSGNHTVSSTADNLPGTLVGGPVWTVGAPLNNVAPRLTLSSPVHDGFYPLGTPLVLAAAASDIDGAVERVDFLVNGIKVGESFAAPYVIQWNGTLGTHELMAMATDNQGAIIRSEPVTVTLAPPPALLLTEVQSNQSSAAATAGAADYWELTNFGAEAVDLEGYTWHDEGRDYDVAQAWALPAGASIAPGESVIFTTATPADFRAWWGLPPSVKVYQTVGAPGLGQNDGIALFTNEGVEVFYFTYAAGGFIRGNGESALGGHAGASGGGAATAALVWEPSSGLLQPRYSAASAGTNDAGQATTGDDVGSPGGGAQPATTLVLVIEPPAFSESAPNPAATGILQRYGDTSQELTVSLDSSDASAATVPASVTFPAGADSVSFDVTAVNDYIVDNNQVARVTASAPGALPVWQDLLVEDDDDQPPPALLLTEVQSDQASDAPAGAADYFEITHFGSKAVSLEGYAWDDDSRDYAAGQAWALPAGASIAPGESVVITTADVAAFRAWWGLPDSVKVYQTAGAPGLGQNDGIALYTNHGVEVFYFTYAADGFSRSYGLPALGGHAGPSAGATETHTALVWDPATTYEAPRYLPANAYRHGGRKAAVGADTGSPGVTDGPPVNPVLPEITTRGPLQFDLVASLPLAGAEISAYDPASKLLFVTGNSGLQMLTLSDASFPQLLGVIDFTQAPFNLSSTDVTSVAAHNGVVAVAVPNAVKQDPGSVVFLDAASGSLLSIVTVGVLPDMVTFTPNGAKVLTANEGEMLPDGTDPAPGSVSIIDVSGGFAAPAVTTVGFEAFDAVAQDLKDAGVRIFEDPLNPSVLKAPSIDFEPEYIAVSPDSSQAMVTLQEANAVALLDLTSNTFTGIVPLGEKDFSELLADFSDRDGPGGTTAINLTTGNPVFGLYMPDAIASYQVNGQTYYVTANEGDDRDDFMTETIRVSDAGYVLDPAVFPNAAELKTNARLGRLTVSNSPGLRGDIDNDGDIDRILAYGGRSISILDASGNLVWDSADLIERLTAELGEPWFDDTRSDNKAAEPEGVTIGVIDDRVYAFVALERSRGVMVFEVTDPSSVKQAGFVSLPTDENPESITFIPAEDSPNGQALLAVTNETSNTLTLFAVSRYTLQLLHLADAEAGLLASQTAPLLATLVEAFEGDYNNTLILAGGDNFIPGPFLSAGTDPLLSTVPAVGLTAFARPDIAIHNILGVEASAIGNHEWDLGTAVFTDAIRPDGAWIGAQFPHLSLNLDYSADSAALARFSDVPLDGTATAVPDATSLKGRLAPVAVVEKGGEKIGLVGVTTQILNSISSPTGTVVKGTTADDLDLLAAQLQPYVDELEAEGVNKIILLSHLQQLTLERALAERLRGVDIILAAGSNTRLGDADDIPVAFPGHAADFADSYPIVSEGIDGAPLLIVNTDNEFTYLGRLLVDFDLEGRIVLESLADYVPEAGAYAATTANAAAAWGVSEAGLQSTAFAPGTKGAAVRQVTQAVQTVINAKDGTIYGYTTVYLEGERSQVRSQETNLGNLTADANLAALRMALGGGDAPLVSFKNGGGIRAQIGAVSSAGGSAEKLPPPANPSVGKPEGGISQLDVENALRFNNTLMTFETTPQGLKELLEHGVAQWPNQGRFPQVGGVMFAWDPARPSGDRITSIALLNADGSAGAPIYKAGSLAAAMLAQAPPLIRVVTLNFLANGGDGYPAKVNGENFRYLLANGTLGPVIADKGLDFTVSPQLPGNAAGEQAALAGYLQTWHGSLSTAFALTDTDYAGDERIQNLLFRADTVPPEMGRDSDGDGLSDLDELLLGSDPDSRLRVGDYVDMNLGQLAGEGETLRLLGKLPNGVKYDPLTRRLTGLIGGLPGLYDLQVLISDGAGGLRAVNLRLGLEAFPARLLAGYEALLEDEAGLPLGIVRVSVTKPSSWSASMEMLGAGKRSAKGSFVLEPGQPRAQLPLLFKASKTAPEILLNLTLDADTPLIAGSFDNGAQNGDLRGFRLASLGGSPPTVRKLNTVLDAGIQNGVDLPAGFGWAKGSVNKSGAVNLKGQLGDAQALALTTKLGATGQALIWKQPYLNKVASYIGGVIPMPDVGQPVALPPALESGAWWFKAADAREKAYENGFAGPVAVAATSAPFAPVKTSPELEVILGLSASTLNLEIEGGGLSNTPGSNPVLPFTFTLLPNFSLAVGTPADAAPWKGKLGKADGGISGTFTLPAGAENLAGKATVSGVLLPPVPGPAGSSVGAGLIKVPVAGKKGAFRTASLLLEP